MEHIFSWYRNKKVLVTGGAGFIGSHIVETLAANGAQVTILDDLSTGSLHNLQRVANKIQLCVGDVSNYDTCVKATHKKDVIFHLAAFISVPESVKNPALCEKINVTGTENILEACCKNNVKQFVLSSSSAVYGNRTGMCRETDPTNPLSPYAKSKLAGEQLCKKYAQFYGISTTCLRYFNVYGPRQNPNGSYAAVVAKFTQNLLNNKPLTIYGNGKQKRDFVHVSHVANANLLAGTRDYSRGEIFNIASGKSITLFELIKQLEQETRSRTYSIRFKPARQGDVYLSQADCSKSLSTLCPQTQFNEKLTHSPPTLN